MFVLKRNLFNRLQSILLKVLRRVYLSLVNNGQWSSREKMDCGFNIVTTVAKRIEGFLETIFELVLPEMT